MDSNREDYSADVSNQLLDYIADVRRSYCPSIYISFTVRFLPFQFSSQIFEKVEELVLTSTSSHREISSTSHKLAITIKVYENPGFESRCVRIFIKFSLQCNR